MDQTDGGGAVRVMRWRYAEGGKGSKKGVNSCRGEAFAEMKNAEGTTKGAGGRLSRPR